MSFEGALFIDPALQSTTHWSNASETDEYPENYFTSFLYSNVELNTGSHAIEYSLDNLAPQGPSNTTVESSVSPTSSPPSSQSAEDLEPIPSTTRGTNRFLCPECGGGYRTKGETRKHIGARHTRPFKCGTVGCRKNTRGFSSRIELLRHINAVHTAEEDAVKFTCVICPLMFKEFSSRRKDNLRSHLRRAHGVVDPNAYMD